MSQRNQPPPSRYVPSDHPDDLQEAIEEIETLESDRPSVEVNITGPHPAIVPTSPSQSPKRSFVPKSLDTPLKKLAACLAALLAAGISALVAEIIRQLTSK